MSVNLFSCSCLQSSAHRKRAELMQEEKKKKKTRVAESLGKVEK